MTSYVTDGTVGPWAREKLECLGKYLSAYTVIMKDQQHWCEGYYFIDAFAGAGDAPLRQYGDPLDAGGQLSIASVLESETSTIDYVKGSPRVALEIEHPFTKYCFVDMSETNTSGLADICQEYSQIREIEIVTGDANNAVRSIVEKIGLTKRQNKRGIVFLDPFGMQLSWATIEFLARTEAIEVLINFPLGMAIQRLLPRSGKFDEDTRTNLTNYFGSPDWEEIVYSEETDLFGDIVRSKSGQSSEKLVRWYQERLQGIFGFSPPPRLITNTKGGHLYYLIFAGPNETGAKIAQHVLSQGTLVR